jgi:hypothetical protein
MATCAASGPGHGLAERDSVEEVLLADPAALLDQVALHVADHGDRAAEPGGAQPQEVPQQVREARLPGAMAAAAR